MRQRREWITLGATFAALVVVWVALWGWTGIALAAVGAFGFFVGYALAR